MSLSTPAAGVETHQPLAPYFPRLVIDWMATAPGERHREEVGTMAFVDISGFTKLSEGLARHGKVGAEELTAAIGSCFVVLLDIAVTYGGRLLKFGGDALLLFFSGDEHQARACRAAVEMRRALRQVGRMTVLGQRVALRMSVGVHSGVFNFFLVGESHREFMVVGPGASTVVLMEGTADAGEIVLSPETAAALRPGVVGAAKGPGHLLRRAPSVSRDLQWPFEPVPEGVDLVSGIPVGLRRAVTEHQESEHRRVTVAFVHFDGTDDMIRREGAAVTADRLDALVTVTQRAVERQEVTFMATDADRDGGKLILAAGAPATSGDDEHRMLLAVREIMDAGTPLPIRIGVNRGSVFAGEVGPPYRRTFTVMGDAVNLAARLMARAETGQILSTPELVARSRTRFETVDLEPFYVKGKAKPVLAQAVGAHVGATAAGAATELPLFGREAEARQLAELAAAAAAGNGAVVEIVGETGSGKSRLVSALRAITSDRLQLTAVCERYDSATPYHEVRRLLRSLLGLPLKGEDNEMSALFLGRLADEAPELQPWAPLIAMAIGVRVPETAESSDLEEEFRRPRLASAVIDLLAKLLPDTGLFVIEDAHNMDEASADLFGHLAAAVGATSWLWCTTRSDLPSGFNAPEGSSIRMELGPLSEEAALEFARAATEDAPLSERELALLVARAGGSPLFLRELIAAARSGDSVESLPESVEEVAAARVDRLPADARRLLRRMSVLGESFTFELLADVLEDLPEAGDPTWEQLEEFVAWDAMGVLSFRDSLLRDSAYGGLTFRLRHQLHSRAADTIRRESTDGHDEQPEILSFHYLHSQRYAEAWEFSLRAAERAVAVYANTEAAEFYERAITASRRLPDLAASQVAEIHEAMGDARNRSGEYTAAAAAYRSARRVIGDDTVAQARLMLKLARVQGWLDRYGSALRWISRGLRVLDDASGSDADRQRAELMGWYGRFCQEQGHHRRAVQWCTLAVAGAEAAGDKAVLADALRVMDWAAMDLGTLERPDNFERALALFEELDDLPGQAGVLNMLGGFAYFKGDWEEASALYLRAQATVRRTGNAVMDAFYVFNLGEIALDQGRLDDAERALSSVLRTWRAAGYRSGTGYAKGKLAGVATGQQRYDDAVRLYQEAIDELSDIGSRSEVLEVQAAMAECLLLRGERAQALSLADQTIAQAQSLGGVAPQMPALLRVRGAALVAAGDDEGARRSLRQSLEAAQSREADYQMALTLRVLAALEADPGEHERLRRSAQEILDKLNVEWTPDLLSPGPGRDGAAGRRPVGLVSVPAASGPEG
ncbi:MAG TPA: adenylate/guanylate cyclase domain-containing protein [Acidimicrobiales bacterium]|nr:adenylate/guanylate cyclase domain-containing protein [Acidimicrobiales bacterium]